MDAYSWPSWGGNGTLLNGDTYQSPSVLVAGAWLTLKVTQHTSDTVKLYLNNGSGDVELGLAGTALQPMFATTRWTHLRIANQQTPVRLRNFKMEA